MLSRSFRCLRASHATRGFVTTAVRQGLAQTHHTFNAQFMGIGRGGIPCTEEFEAFTEDLSYPGVFIPGRIGRAFQKGIVTASSSAIHPTSDRIPLVFFHDARAFADKSTPIPRLTLPHDLPRQTDTNESPATLFIFNAGNVITLNGTEAAEFFGHALDSAKALAPVLERLKDM